MKFDTVQLVEQGAGGEKRNLLTIPYAGVKTLEWDHSCSSVKISAGGAGGAEAYCVVKVGNSLELENEAKLRIRGLSRQGSGAPLNLTFAYCGTRVRRAERPLMHRGDAAATTWLFRQGRVAGCDAAIPPRRRAGDVCSRGKGNR